MSRIPPENPTQNFIVLANEEKARRIFRDGDKVKAVGVTDAGPKKNNEDAFVLSENGCAAIDAMGGGSKARGAARVVAESVGETFKFPAAPLGRIAKRAATAMRDAKAAEDFDDDRDGATLALARDTEDTINGLVVGDAGLFIFDITAGGIVEQADEQSCVQELIKAIRDEDLASVLKLIQEDVKIDPDYLAGIIQRMVANTQEVANEVAINRIRSAIGTKVMSAPITASINSSGEFDAPPIQVNFKKEPGHKYVVLLCSDGATKCLTGGQMLRIVMDNKDNLSVAAAKVNNQVQAVQQAGDIRRADHSTVVLMDTEVHAG